MSNLGLDEGSMNHAHLQVIHPDFFFVPLIYLESFSSPAAVLEIDNAKIQMPLDWHILLGDPECGDFEILPLTSLNRTCLR